MLTGIILASLGLIGTVYAGAYIENDWRYTYTSPFTDHEKMVLFLLFVCVVAAVVGIVSIIFSVIKKKNQDMLNRVQEVSGDGKKANMCPRCGLNLAEGVETCPKCAAKLGETVKG